MARGVRSGSLRFRKQRARIVDAAGHRKQDLCTRRKRNTDRSSDGSAAEPSTRAQPLWIQSEPLCSSVLHRPWPTRQMHNPHNLLHVPPSWSASTSIAERGLRDAPLPADLRRCTRDAVAPLSCRQRLGEHSCPGPQRRSRFRCLKPASPTSESQRACGVGQTANLGASVKHKCNLTQSHPSDACGAKPTPPLPAQSQPTWTNYRLAHQSCCVE